MCSGEGFFTFHFKDHHKVGQNRQSFKNTRIPFCVCAIDGVFKMIFKLKQLKFHRGASYRNSMILFHSNDPEFPAKD